MIYVNAFLFSSIICLLGEILYLKTKLTPGHITTLFVIVGCVLAGVGVYDILIDVFGGGASCLILNFGNLLVKGGLEGAKENGIYGMFSSLLKYCTAVLSYVIFISILLTLLPKIRIKK